MSAGGLRIVTDAGESAYAGIQECVQMNADVRVGDEEKPSAGRRRRQDPSQIGLD